MFINSIDKYMLADMVEGADRELAMSCETTEEYVVRKLLAAEDLVMELTEENSDLRKELKKLKNSLKNCNSTQELIRIKNTIIDSENEKNEENEEEDGE